VAVAKATGHRLITLNLAPGHVSPRHLFVGVAPDLAVWPTVRPGLPDTSTRRVYARRFGQVLATAYPGLGQAWVVARAWRVAVIHRRHKPCAPTKLRTAPVCVRVAVVAAGLGVTDFLFTPRLWHVNTTHCRSFTSGLLAACRLCSPLSA
jgi:hypothetical protein